MSKARVLSVLFVTACSGFLGGFIASWLSLGASVIAQSRSGQNVPRLVTAREFRLVDEKNVRRASLHTYPGRGGIGTALLLSDRDGETRFLVTVEEGTPNVHLFDKHADVFELLTDFPSISFWDRGRLQLKARLPGSLAGRGKIQPLPERLPHTIEIARSQDVRLLQRQVDQLWERLEEVIERLNASAE